MGLYSHWWGHLQVEDADEIASGDSVSVVVQLQREGEEES